MPVITGVVSYLYVRYFALSTVVLHNNICYIVTRRIMVELIIFNLKTKVQNTFYDLNDSRFIVPFFIYNCLGAFSLIL